MGSVRQKVLLHARDFDVSNVWNPPRTGKLRVFCKIQAIAGSKDSRVAAGGCVRAINGDSAFLFLGCGCPRAMDSVGSGKPKCLRRPARGLMSSTDSERASVDSQNREAILILLLNEVYREQAML